MSKLPQDSPIRGGTLNTQHALQKTHVLNLQITREDLVLLINKLSAPHLHTTKSIAQISLGAVFNVSSYLYEFGCGSDCMYFFHECCGM